MAKFKHNKPGRTGMNRIFYGMCFLTLMFLIATNAHATYIEYEATNLSGNTWEYLYTVHNDTLTTDIEEFTIYFQVGLFENLAMAGAPTDWDPLAIEPDLLLPDDGFYDALALSSGIAPMASQGGFSVRFDYLGMGAPGPQHFEIVNPTNFAVMDSGMTRLASVPMPEPGTALLLLGGLLGGLAIAKRRNYR
jgi:hypothetical protein